RRDQEAPVNVRAARGAIVVPRDDAASMHAATATLLDAILQRNTIAHDDLISILFTATEDLSSACPAEAARRMGLGDIPLLCPREIPVVGVVASVVGILLTCPADVAVRVCTKCCLDGPSR